MLGAARSFSLLCLLGAACVAAPLGPARAQGFLERLFGVPPRQVAPPAQVPVVPEAPLDQRPAPPREYVPPPPKPVAVKPVSEEGVIGKELKQNGRTGSFRIERAGAELRARVTLQGAKVSRPTEACTVSLGEGAVPLANQGRPDGVPRYVADAPVCPIAFNVLDGALHVNAPTQACTFEAADCRVEAGGLWGPEPAALVAQAKTIEQARGEADRAVRENYRALTQRAGPAGVRPVVSEQAAFSSEREQLCRDYAREPAHGFCGTRFTEGRALSLAARLGLNTSASAAAPPPATPRRPRPSAPALEAE